MFSKWENLELFEGLSKSVFEYCLKRINQNSRINFQPNVCVLSNGIFRSKIVIVDEKLVKFNR